MAFQKRFGSGILFVVLISLLYGPVFIEAKETIVYISSEDCKNLIQKNRNNSPDYQPGVDVRGAHVPSSDAKGEEQSFTVPQILTFNLSLDMRRYLSEDHLSSVLGESDAIVGIIKYDQVSGHLTFNDQPLPSSLASDVAFDIKRSASEEALSSCF